MVLAALGVVTCITFFLLGVYLENTDFISFFGAFGIAFTFVCIAIKVGLYKWAKPLYFLCVVVGVFLISELLGDKSHMSMMYPMELVFIFVFYNESKRLRWGFIGLVMITFFISSYPEAKVFNAYELPKFYFDWVNQIIALIAFFCIGLVLELNLKMFKKVRKKSRAKVNEPSDSAEIQPIYRSLLVEEIDNLYGAGESIPFARAPDEMSKFLSVWKGSARRINRLLLSMSPQEEAFSENLFESSDCNKFVDSLKVKVYQESLPISLRVDETLSNKSIILPFDYAETWFVEILGSFKKFKSTTEKVEFLFHKSSDDLWVELSVLQQCSKSEMKKLKILFELIKYEVESFGYGIEILYASQEINVKWTIYQRENDYPIRQYVLKKENNLMASLKNKVAIYNADGYDDELICNRMKLLGASYSLVDSLKSIENRILDDRYDVVLYSTSAFTNRDLEWIQRIRHHENVLVRNTPFVIWYEHLSGVDLSQLKRINELKLIIKPSTLEELKEILQ
jgi:large-conductance mechanosensitive channel